MPLRPYDRVLITGASSGIGKELARMLGKEGHPLVLVARRQELLQELQEELEEVEVHVIPLDLTAPNSVEQLLAQTEDKGLPIDVLVNNAGIGTQGAAVESSQEEILRLLRLNVEALTLLSHAFAKRMVQRGSGQILHVASMAAFQPGPYMATYYASKAYVLSLSQALREELREKNVGVSALCPGPTETEFFDAKEMGGKELKLRRSLSLKSAEEVAFAGLKAIKKNRSVVIPGLLNRLLIFLSRFTPRIFPIKVCAWLNR